ncbi:MAG: hypothetical protein Q9222_002831 [Ikaeria aurantiellina]
MDHHKMVLTKENDNLQGTTSQIANVEDRPDRPSSCSPSKTWSNPRKRPNNSQISPVPKADDDDLSLLEVSNGADSYSQKRIRASDWPLKDPVESGPSFAILSGSLGPPVSSARSRRMVAKPRPSKFLEGSMNDRASTKPPSIYIRDDEAMEEYHAGDTRSGFTSQDSNDLDDDKMYYDAGIEITKQSGMYRFGKALASAFNPVNVWQGINGIWKNKEPLVQPEKSVLQERKVKAEIAYSHLKNEGFIGTQPLSTRAASMDRSKFSGRGSQDYSGDSSYRDSAVGFDEPRISHASSRVQPTPSGSEDLLVPSSVLKPALKVSSPFSQADSTRKTSMNLRRPSLPSLKKVKSHIQLPSAKRRVPDLQPSAPSSAFATRHNSEQKLTRQPSKRDMAKQAKLSKHVSNLESKLDAARRELQLSRGQIPDVPKIPRGSRKVFNPGTLSSLPSESILQSSIPGEEHSNPTDRDRDQLWTPKKSESKVRSATTTPASRQPSVHELEATPASSRRKRKSSSERAANATHKFRQSEDDDSDPDWRMSMKKIPRARKSRKIEETSSPHHNPAKPATSYTKSVGPTDSPSVQTQTLAVSVPKLGSPFDATKVDKAKLIAMRSIPNDNIPFGSHLDDIVNLQKTFPLSNQKQIDEYLLSLRTASPNATKYEKTSDQTHHTCRNSSPNRSIGRDLSTIHESVVVDPSKDKSIPPLPRSNALGLRQATHTNVSRFKPDNKPLPGVPKEDYNWPEDVF